MNTKNDNLNEQFTKISYRNTSELSEAVATRKTLVNLNLGQPFGFIRTSDLRFSFHIPVLYRLPEQHNPGASINDS